MDDSPSLFVTRHPIRPPLEAGLQQDPSSFHKILVRRSLNVPLIAMSLSVLVLLLSFAIPILGIGLAGYKEWLKFRAKQQELGASTEDVEATVKALRDRLEMVEDERDALEQRVQNLETILTSETWDALHDATADPSSLPEATDPVELPSHEDRTDQDASMQEQAEELARRLRA